MDLIPESIKGDNTQALDQTFLERLMNMGVEQLSIDFANDTDMTKLSLWLQQFGIPVELLPTDLDGFTLRDLLPRMVRIYNLSGTDVSIELLAQALGADKAEVVRESFILDYNCQSRHDELFQYNRGREYRSFGINVKIWGVSSEKRTDYETVLRKLFSLFEPVHLYLNKVYFQYDAKERLLVSEDGKIILLEDDIHIVSLMIQ